MLIDESFIHVHLVPRVYVLPNVLLSYFFFLGQLVVPVRYGRMMALRVHLLDLADFGDA